MGIPKQFWLLYVLSCFLEYVHSMGPCVSAETHEDPLTCGISKRFSQNRPIQGIVKPSGHANLGDWPWMGAMFYYNYVRRQYESNCGSVLISDLWVLTAAHCVFNPSSVKLVFVRFGTVDNRPQSSNMVHQIDRFVKKIIPHPGFIRSFLRNDIALIRLDEAVPVTDFVRPVCLPPITLLGDNAYEGRDVFLSGWGRPSENGAASPWLKEGELTVTNRGQCAAAYAKRHRAIKIDETVLCAGITGSASCYGDSGGPLMFLNNTNYHVYAIGIVSTGDGCNPYVPSVLTRIAHYNQWIRTTMNSN